MAYRNDTILTKEGFLLSLLAIEALKEGREDEDNTYDALKGDVILIARTLGGYEYIISMQHIKAEIPEHFKDEDVREMARNTVNRWKFIKIHKDNRA